MRNVIFGAGGFGREVATLLRTLPESKQVPTVFAVDEPTAPTMLGLDIIRAEAIGINDRVFIAVGDGVARQQVEAKLKPSGCSFPSVHATSALVTADATIGDGAVFSDFTMVTAPARIGRQFQCNIYSYVAHDCEIGDYVTFAPRVCCNGNVRIGDFAYIGTNATIKQGITIGPRAIVGMGAVVVKDVPEGATVVGNPAKARE